MLAGDMYVEMLCKRCNDLASTILLRAFPGMTLDVMDREKMSRTD
jgi:hypothetical protein